MATSQVTEAATQQSAGIDNGQLQAAADAVVSFWDRIEKVFTQFMHHVSVENLLLQIAIVLVSILIGYVISRQLNGLVIRWIPNPEEKGIGVYLRRLFVKFVKNISFSVVSGCVLALGAYILIAGLNYHPASLFVCRVAYNLFFSFALLSLLMECLQGMLGQHWITPRIRRFVTTAFWALAVLQFFGILTDLVDKLNSVSIPLGSGSMTVWTLFMAIFSILLTLAIANWLANLVHQFIEGLDNISRNIKVVLSRIVTVLFMILAVVTALGSVGIDLTVLSVFGGALGVGLGFGLQKIASNYISGFIILLDKSIKIGDLVTVSGFRGEVTEINTRYTVVRNADGVENIVPNESFVTSPVMNYSYGSESCVYYINVSVAYDADVERAMAIMLEEGMRERPRIDTTRRGWAYIDSFGASGINLSLGFWIQDPKNGSAGLRNAISLAILKRFAEEGIEIPYDRLDVNLREVDAKEVPVNVVNAPKAEAQS